MNSNEEYLDELLKAIEPITNPQKASEEGIIEESEIEVSAVADEPSAAEEEQMQAQGQPTDEAIGEEIQSEASTETEDAYQSMTEEEIDALINEAKAVTPQEINDSDEADITELLEQYSGDENVDDIQELLKKDENREVVDEAILLPEDEPTSDAESDTEPSFEKQPGMEPPAKEKGKRPWREKRKKKEKEEETPQGEGTDSVEKDKKPNIFLRVLKMLTEEDESLDEETEAVPEAAETGITDENLNILNELSKEDKKREKKKSKKKKGKEDKKPGEDGEAEADKADNKKGKKEKKPKREKKQKKEKSQEPAAKERKLPKKKVIATFAFCLTIMAVIIIMSAVFTDIHSKSEARWAFDNEDFQSCYENLYGKKLSEADQAIYDKSELVLAMNRKLSSYENFKKLGMNVEALNALFEGVKLYDRIAQKASDLGITDRIETLYQSLYSKFTEYGLSDGDVTEILASEDALTYTKRLDSIVNGTPFEPDKEETQAEAVPLENVLPEEEDFLPDDNTILPDTIESGTQQETEAGTDETEETASEQPDGAVQVGSQSNVSNTDRPGTQVGDGSMNMEAPVKDGEAVLER